MGFDDIRYAEVTDPPLTTISQPGEENGERVMYWQCHSIEEGRFGNNEPEIVLHKQACHIPLWFKMAELARKNMSKRRPFLKSVLATILLLVIAVILLFTLDLGRFKGFVEARVSSATGHEFSINGDLSIHLGRTIDVSATGLRLAGPEWMDRPDQARIADMAASIDLRSLLSGPVIIESMNINDAELYLAVSPDGEKSWQFPGPKPPITVHDSIDSLILFRNVTISNLGIELATPRIKRPIVTQVDSFVLQHMPDDFIHVRTSGDINGRTAEYNGTIGTFANIVAGRDIRYQGHGVFGALTFDGSGYIDDLTKPIHPEFSLALSGSEFGDVTAMLGLDEMGSGAFRLEAVAARVGEKLDFSIDGDVGSFAIDLKGKASSIRDYRETELSVTAEGPDIGAFSGLLGLDGWPAEAFELEGDLVRSGKQLDIHKMSLFVGEAQFRLNGSMSDFPHFNSSQLDLEIAGDDIGKFRELLGFKGIATGAFDLTGKLEVAPGGINLVRIDLANSLGKAHLSGQLGPGPDYVGSELALQLSGPQAKVVLDGFGFEGFPPGPFDLDSHFTILKNGLDIHETSRLRLQDDQLEITGLIGFASLENETDVQFRVSGDDFSEYTALAGAVLAVEPQPFDLSGRLRTVPVGFHGDGIKGKIGSNRVEISGLVARGPGLIGTDLSIAISGPDLATLHPNLSVLDFMDSDFDLSGRVQKQRDTVSVEKLALRIGQINASANLSLVKPGDHMRVRFDADIDGPDINQLLPEFKTFKPLSNPFELSAKGDWQEGAWALEQATLNIGDAYLKIGGVLDQQPDFSATDLSVEARINDLAQLGGFTTKQLPPWPLNLEAHFSGTVDEFRADKLIGQIGKTDFSGFLVASFKNEVPDISFKTESSLINLIPLADYFEQDANRDTTTPTEDGRVIPDYLFPFEKMASVNIDLNVVSDLFRIPRRDFHNFTLEAELRDGALNISRIHSEGLRGEAELSAHLRPLPGGGMDFAVDVDVVDLVLDLQERKSSNIDQLPKFDINYTLTGIGKGLREVAGRLNGNFFATSTGGTMVKSGVHIFDLFLLERVVGAIVPSIKDNEDVSIECFGARLVVTDGLIRSDPGIALVTDKMRMFAEGTIDLKTEEIDLAFETEANKIHIAALGEFISPFIRLTGTLGDVQPVVDAQSTLIHSGVAIGTAGLSIIASQAFDQFNREDNPCVEFMKSAEDR